jgi:hypothetical protein
MRKDGKFVGADGSIPEGQAIVVAHLSECHELVEMVDGFLSFVIHVFTPSSAERIHGREGWRGGNL